MMRYQITRLLRDAVEHEIAMALMASSGFMGQTLDGEHWQWVCSHCDEAASLSETDDGEFMRCPLCNSVAVDLRSVEKYSPPKMDMDRSRPLPNFITHGSEEVPSAAGRFIVRNNPASMMNRYRHDLGILDRHPVKSCSRCVGTFWCAGCDPSGSDFSHTDNWPCVEIVELARVYGWDL